MTNRNQLAQSNSIKKNHAMKINRLIFALMVIFISLDIFGCNRSENKSPGRPQNVPLSAIWSGGLDGGVWFDCREDIQNNSNECAIYSDQKGELWIKARYQLQEERRMATPSEFRDPYVDHFPDATVIHLANHKKLVATKVFYVRKMF